MKLEDLGEATRVVSRSDGFTAGLHGVVRYVRIKDGEQDCAFVRWDNGLTSYVSLDLCELEAGAN